MGVSDLGGARMAASYGAVSADHLEYLDAEGAAAMAAILAEADEWQRIMALDGEVALDVYLDMKSPHAYVAVRPSLQVAGTTGCGRTSYPTP